MKINLIRSSVFIIFFFISGFVYSQKLGSETVVVVKPYAPSVNDAFKIREMPAITDTLDLEKMGVEYSIFSFPVVSTFSPAKGRAASVDRPEPPEVYNSYATLGFGSYTSALAEFYTNFEVSRTDNFGIFLTHNSAQGGIEEVPLEQTYSETELNLNYASRQREAIWKGDFGLEHFFYNWYGVSPLISDYNEIEPGHNYFSAYFDGEANFEDSFFNRGEVEYRFFADDEGSAEHHLVLNPVLEVPLGGEIFKTEVILDYVRGGFEREYFRLQPINYGLLNLGVSSGLVILRDNLTLNLRAAVYYSLDSEHSENQVYLYPKVTASYEFAGEYFIGYAGLEGGLEQNTYYDLVEENPFLSPTLMILPTDQEFDAYVGAKGKLSSSIGYNTRLSYVAENQKPLYVSNAPMTAGSREDYGYANSFTVVYDNLSTVSAFGELSIGLSRDFDLRVNASYFVYDTDEQEEAWNLPNFKANLLADYRITDKWYAGTNIFVVGKRTDRTISNIAPMPNLGAQQVNLDPYLDLNANLGYRFNDRLSIFAKGNNLLGENYEKWLNYPVLGLQVLAGATYKFDFEN